MQLSGRVEAVVDGVLRGWAWDAARPGLRLAVAVLADGRRIATCRADRPRGDLRRNGIGDGAHGLECPLPLELLDGAEHDFVLAADGDPAPAEIARGRLAVPRQGHLLHGRLERIEPRRVTGWVADRARPGTPVPVELVAGGAVVARTLADRFRRDLLEAGIGSGAHGFVFELGEEVAALPPGTEILVRAGSDFGHWELARRRLAHPAGVADEAREGAAQALRPLLEEARAAERRGELRRAAGLLDEALALAPGEFETLAIRARVAFALGAAEDAGRFARAALALRPGHVRPTVILARLASARGDHAEAAELWSAVPAGDSCYRERLVKRGRALAALGRPREAMAEFGAALALDPDDRDALRGQAQLAEGLGGLRTAGRLWRRLAALSPEDASAAERLRAIEAPAPPPPRLASPLANPTLRHWPGALDGVADAAGAEPSPGVRLRALGGGLLRYAVGWPAEPRPGALPVYGLDLRAESGGGEVAFALDPAQESLLCRGLALGWEVAADAPLAVAIRLGGAERPLASAGLPRGPRLLAFDLLLAPAERPLLEAGLLSLVLRLDGAGRLLLRPPRPLRRLDEEAPAGSAAAGFEDPVLRGRPWPAGPAAGQGGTAAA